VAFSSLPELAAPPKEEVMLAQLLLVAFSTSAPLDEDATTFIRLSLDAEALAAAGVSAAEVPGVVTALEESDEAQSGALATADAAWAAARQEADRLSRIVRAGNSTPQDVTDLTAAKEAFAGATAARDAVLDALFDAGTGVLSAGEQAVLAEVRANRRWKLSMEFLVISRTEAQWVELRDNLMAEKVCAKIGDTLDSEVVQALSAARAQTDVAAAKALLDANLAAVRAAWDAAFE
jgi:hypothetical protein